MAGGGPVSGRGGAVRAARQLEELLLQQLWKSMRRTVRGGMLGSATGSSVYGGMLDDAMAQALSEGGGLGFAGMLARQLGGDRGSPLPPSPSSGAVLGPVRHMRSPFTERAAVSPRGALGKVLEAAARLAEGDPLRWARPGRLGPQDLSSDFSTKSAAGVARFNVRDAGGYAGENKCNLFVFEALRRAGFLVPLVPRGRGWGYPSTNALVEDATDGRMRRGWADVVHGEDAGALDGRLRAGRPLLLVASGTEGRSGHAALLERVHRVDLGSEGHPVRIEFDGWEARSGDGARRLVRRVWVARGGGRPVRGARHGLGRIAVLAVRRAVGGRPEVPLGAEAPPSRLDRKRPVEKKSSRRLKNDPGSSDSSTGG